MHHFEVSKLDRLVVYLITHQKAFGVGRIFRYALWMLGVDVPPAVSIGHGMRFRHASSGLVIHPCASIGNNVTFLHGVTIGRADLHLRKDQDGTEVVVGDNVVFGTGAVVLVRSGRRLTIGEGAVVGANAVITRDIAPREVWAGNPATRIVIGDGS